MATETHGAETGGLEFHPMDQFIVSPLFGDDASVAWYTITNATFWMALAVLGHVLNWSCICRNVSIRLALGNG